MTIFNGSKLLALAVVSTVLLGSVPAMAQESTSAAKSPLKDAGYLSVSGSFVSPDDALDLKDGYGANVMIGLRSGIYAIEIGGNYTEFSGTDSSGFSIAGLLFPFDSSGLFLLVGGSANRYEQLPALQTNLPSRVDSFSVAAAEAGAGYLLPLSVGRYEFGIRFDARYRYGRREKELNERNEDLPLPRKLQDFTLNLGLQLPFSFRPIEVQNAPPEPAKVVDLPQQPAPAADPATATPIPYAAPDTTQQPSEVAPAEPVAP